MRSHHARSIVSPCIAHVVGKDGHRWWRWCSWAFPRWMCHGPRRRRRGVRHASPRVDVRRMRVKRKHRGCAHKRLGNHQRREIVSLVYTRRGGLCLRRRGHRRQTLYLGLLHPFDELSPLPLHLAIHRVQLHAEAWRAPFEITQAREIDGHAMHGERFGTIRKFEVDAHELTEIGVLVTDQESPPKAHIEDPRRQHLTTPAHRCHKVDSIPGMDPILLTSHGTVVPLPSTARLREALRPQRVRSSTQHRSCEAPHGETRLPSPPCDRAPLP